jgi:hypothetical protein
MGSFILVLDTKSGLLFVTIKVGLNVSTPVSPPILRKKH